MTDNKDTKEILLGGYDPTIICPECNTEIKLTESLVAPLIQATQKKYEAEIATKEKSFAKREAQLKQQQREIEKDRENIDEQVAEKIKSEQKKYEAELATKEKSFAKREVQLKQQQREIEKDRENIDEQVAEKIKSEKAVIVKEERKKAKIAADEELSAKSEEVAYLEQLLKERNDKLKGAQKAEAEMLRKKREFEDKERELDLTVEKQVQETVSAIREKAKDEAEQALTIKLTEKEEQITSMSKQIDDLKRKAEQGSQQLQGEAFELVLEETLENAFPADNIEPVRKGKSGGDVLQRVKSPEGTDCGLILWEAKRTKKWSPKWISKLRDDQRAAKAEIAIIVSQALPKDIKTFGTVKGVWITGPQYCVPLAIALRQSLIEVNKARIATEGQQTKTELVYKYLTGPNFRHRIEAIVEKFSDMQDDLKKERARMTQLWAKRETQIRGVIESTVGMYGDLQGIAGREIPEIKGLELSEEVLMLEDKQK